MKLRVIRPVKAGGKWHSVDSVVDVEKEDARRLIEIGAAKPVDKGEDIDPDLDPQGAAIQALCKLDGVNKTVAKVLIEAGFNSPDDLREAEVSAEDLAELEGIGDRTAERIIDALNEEDNE